MILTCPECATSYFVDEARVPPEGRTVKCSSCGARWRAYPEAAPEPEPQPAADIEAEDVAAEAAETEPELAPEDVEIVAEPAPARRRPPPPSQRKPAGLGGAGVWIAAAAVVALLVGGVAVFRQEVVRLWPASSQAFASLGLPTDSLGLVIDEVKTQPTFQAGRPVLSVTGAIRNTRDEAVTAPALRVSLLDKAGKPLAIKLARPLNAEIPAGAKRYFALAIPEPPAGSQELEVAFDAEAGARHADAQPVEAVLGPEPMEAKPLPPGTPHALPDHG